MIKNKEFIKTIFCIVLAVVVVFESTLLIIGKGTSKIKKNTIRLNVDTAAIMSDVQLVANDIVSKIVSRISTEEAPALNLENLDIKETAKKFIFSDTIVNAVMSISYPLLYETTEKLGLIDFSDGVNLFPKPTRVAEFFRDKLYTGIDSTGNRVSLFELFTACDKDWSYMNQKAEITDKNGNKRAYTLWNTVRWGVTDEESFYRIMADMFEPLRGIFEICMRGQTKRVSINLAGFVIGTDISGLDYEAATIYNTETDFKTNGYEHSLIPLFNALGLKDGDYPTKEEFFAYTDIADFWRTLFGTIMKGVDKIAEDPVNGLTNLIVNFGSMLESGSLVSGLKTMSLDGRFGTLAKLAMGFSDGLLFNLGDTLIGTIESIGINIHGNMTDFFSSIGQLLTGDEKYVARNFDLNSILASCSSETLPNGNVYYTANSNRVLKIVSNYLIDLLTG